MFTTLLTISYDTLDDCLTISKCHHRGSRDTRVNKHPATFRQHCGEKFRLERDSCDKCQTYGGNGWEISELHRARPQKPTRICNPGEHEMGGIKDMGSGDQCRPPQDYIEILIQSRPQRGVNLQSIANTCHIGRHTRPKKRKGTGRIGGHSQSGYD